MTVDEVSVELSNSQQAVHRDYESKYKQKFLVYD